MKIIHLFIKFIELTHHDQESVCRKILFHIVSLIVLRAELLEHLFTSCNQLDEKISEVVEKSTPYPLPENKL
ncbi:hypothetical protein BXU10_05670 [Flavobacterium sp. LM4]|nr:hypothetical protein BXU10_05670 [Flavobacterium sp. LM4]